MYFNTCFYELLNNPTNEIFDICYNLDINLLRNIIYFIRNKYFGYSNDKILSNYLDFLYYKSRDEYKNMISNLLKFCGNWGDIIDEYPKKDTKKFILNLIVEQIKKDKKNYDNGKYKKLSKLCYWIPNENSAKNKELNNINKEIAINLGITQKELRKNYLVPIRQKTYCIESYLNTQPEFLPDIHKFSKYILKKYNNFLIKNYDNKYTQINVKLSNYELTSKNNFIYNNCNNLYKALLNNNKFEIMYKKCIDCIPKFLKLYNFKLPDEKCDFTIYNFEENNLTDIYTIMIYLINKKFGINNILYPVINKENNTIKEYIYLHTLEPIDALKCIINNKLNLQLDFKINNNALLFNKKNIDKKGIYWYPSLSQLKFNYNNNNTNILGFNPILLPLISYNGKLNEQLYIYNINEKIKSII